MIDTKEVKIREEQNSGTSLNWTYGKWEAMIDDTWQRNKTQRARRQTVSTSRKIMMLFVRQSTILWIDYTVTDWVTGVKTNRGKKHLETLADFKNKNDGTKKN